jgi:hypothetical protein
MQATPDVVERGAKPRQRIGLLVDILEFDRPGAHQRQQLIALPVDAGVADGAAGVVVDGEVLGHWMPTPPKVASHSLST